MTSDNRSQHLSRLRRSAERTVRSFNRRNLFSAPRPPTRQGKAVRPLTAQESSSGAGIAASDGLAVSVNLIGATLFLDDERRVRALAKEIKRLITEDQRRGLGL